MPLVGGVELYFMQMPDFDYSLSKLVTVAEIPGVSNIIKSVLDNIIRRGFVWPNRFSFFFPIESVENLRNQTFAMPAPQGVLVVEVVRGRHLVKKDKHLLGGKSDPYVVLAIGEKKISFKDRYAESTVDPEWRYTAEFPVEEVSGLDLNIEVYDYDTGSEDDFMGRTAVSIQAVVEKSIQKSWIRLDDAKHGEIELSAHWRPVLPAHDITEKSDIYVVSVFVDSCRHLDSGKSSPPFSKCELSVSNPSSSNLAPSPLSRRDSKKWIPSARFEAYTTIPRGPSENPVFREGHFFLCKNPNLDSIAVQVVDHRSGLLLGSTWVELKHLLSLPDKQFSRMEMPLENNQNSDSVIVLSAKVYAAVN